MELLLQGLDFQLSFAQEAFTRARVWRSSGIPVLSASQSVFFCVFAAALTERSFESSPRLTSRVALRTLNVSIARSGLQESY